MPRGALVTVLVVAGVALVIALFFVLRPGSESEPVAGETTAVTEATTAGTTAPPPSAEPTPGVLDVAVRGGEPVGGIQRLTVHEGDDVSVRVASDVDDEVHVHGYDLSGEVGRGGTAELEFTAAIVGRFEIELEERGTTIAVLEVRP